MPSSIRQKAVPQREQPSRTAHTRADPFGSVPKLVRIGLPCTREHSYPIQFGSAIRTRLVRIKKGVLVWFRSTWLPCAYLDRAQTGTDRKRGYFSVNTRLNFIVYFLFSQFVRHITKSEHNNGSTKKSINFRFYERPFLIFVISIKHCGYSSTTTLFPRLSR